MPSFLEPHELQEQLSRMPLFSEIKPRSMKALVEELDIRPVEAGVRLVRQGEYSSDFYVVLRGMATAYRTEADGATGIVGTHGAGDWFGEMTALSHQPQFATVKIETASVVLVLSDVLFQQIYQGGGSFRTLVDERYRGRALAVHLRTAPLFKRVNTSLLKDIAAGAELVTFKNGEVIARAGDDAAAVFLVRSGVVKRVIKHPDTGAEVVQAYLCDNSSFGERSLLDEGRRLLSSYVAMSPVALVKISRELFEKVFGVDPDASQSLHETAHHIVASESGRIPSASGSRSAAELDVMVNKKAIVGGRALVIDLRKCTRCNACVESCVAVHEDGVPRLNKRGIRAGDHMLTSACYHCKIPECMLSCNFGAIRRDLQGGIEFITDNCVGCTACEEKCPYGVINMAEVLPRDAQTEARRRSFLASMPILGRFLGKRGEEPERELKAIKCDLCAGMPFEACVYNCPCGAISRITPERLVAEGTFDD